MFRSFSCPLVGEREPITISYQGPLLCPYPPCGPSFVLLHLYPAPQHVGFRVKYWTGAVGYFWHYRSGAMQDRGYELLRIHLLRTPVNKGKEKGQSYRCQISPTSSQTAPPPVW